MSKDRRAYMREFHARRRELTAANGGIAPVVAHGVRSTYTDWGCTCDDCRSAASAYNREWRQSRRTRGDRKVAS